MTYTPSWCAAHPEEAALIINQHIDSLNELKHRTDSKVAFNNKLVDLYKEELQLAESKVSSMREACLTHRAYLDNSTWLWIGDGSDNLNSMSNSMAIVISAGKLRELIDSVVDDSVARALRTNTKEDNGPNHVRK